MSRFSLERLALMGGLVIGLLLGLAYTWGIAPVEVVNSYPAVMRSDYRWDWIRMAALSYVADGDLERVRWRLDGLAQQDIAGAMEALLEEYAAAGRPAETMRRLTGLAQALGVHTSTMLVYEDAPAAEAARTPPPLPSATPLPSVQPTATSVPALTATPKPTRTPRPPTPTPPPLQPFQLAGKEQICEPGQAPDIEVIVQDERGEGLAGTELWLMWPGGADRAMTGLKPEWGAGYADFDADPGLAYSLGTSELGVPLITNLQIEPCPQEKGKEQLLGSWRIVLERRPPPTAEPEDT